MVQQRQCPKVEWVCKVMRLETDGGGVVTVGSDGMRGSHHDFVLVGRFVGIDVEVEYCGIKWKKATETRGWGNRKEKICLTDHGPSQ